MALEVMVGFLGIGQSARSISRRVVKLPVPHYLFMVLPPQKRGYGHKIQKLIVSMIPSTGSGLGMACTMAVILGLGKCQFTAIGQIFLL